jgi:nicotinamidase-related amidase
MTSALLIIDVQNALCSGDEAAFDIENVIARINLLSAAARAVEAPVLLVQHEEAGGSLTFASEGWQLAAGLRTSPDDLRVRKKTPNSFHETELHTVLQERAVSRLVVCGLQSDFCVDTTVRQALALGYDVVLASDAHSTTDNGILSAAQITAHHNRTLRFMTSFGPRISVMHAREIRFEA